MTAGWQQPIFFVHILYIIAPNGTAAMIAIFLSLSFSLQLDLSVQSVTLHTNLGDLKCEIDCDLVPKTAEVRSFFFFLLTILIICPHFIVN